MLGNGGFESDGQEMNLESFNVQVIKSYQNREITEDNKEEWKGRGRTQISQ